MCDYYRLCRLQAINLLFKDRKPPFVDIFTYDEFLILLLEMMVELS